MSEPIRPRRRYLGRAHTLSERVRTYWTDEALEVDWADNYEIHRRRVFFDEILMVALHRTRGLPIAIIPLCVGLIFGIVAQVTPEDRWSLWGAAAVLFALAAAAGLAPVWVVTAFGKRTRSRMRFPLRQTKAREVYAEVCRAAAEAQRALALRLASEIPEQPPPPLPLSDSDYGNSSR